MRKILTLLVSFILPGIGQIICGRIAVGITFFVAEVLVLNVYIFLMLAAPDVPAISQRVAIIVLAAVIWLCSQLYLVYLLYFFDPGKHDEEKELVFQEGLRYYIRGELADAIRQFERILRLDSTDFDTHFHIGVCHSRAGNYLLAKRHLKKCIEYDEARKWAVDVQDEMRLMTEQQPREQAHLGKKLAAEAR